MKGILTCKVCGRDFALVAEDHYIARSIKSNGPSLSDIIASPTEPVQYDAIDCPHCGCQNILQKREHIQWFCEEEGVCTVCDGCEDPENVDECLGCIHETNLKCNYPCNECSRCYNDHWEKKEEN